MNKKTKLFFCLISTTLVSCEPSLIVNKTFTGLSLSHKLYVEEDIYKFSNANPDHFYSPRADFIKDLQDKKVTIKDEKSHQIIDSYYISKTKEAYFYFSYADQTTQVKNDKIKEIGDFEKPDFREIVKCKADLAVLPGQALPAKVTKKSSQEEKDASEKTLKQLQRLQTRFSSLAVPLLIDRACDEETNYAKAEWAKVYGEIFGETKAADQLLNQYIKKNKEEKIIHE